MISTGPPFHLKGPLLSGDLFVSTLGESDDRCRYRQSEHESARKVGRKLARLALMGASVDMRALSRVFSYDRTS